MVWTIRDSGTGKLTNAKWAAMGKCSAGYQRPAIERRADAHHTRRCRGQPGGARPTA